MNTPIARFAVLYAALYAAYGVASPFVPAFLGSRGLTPQELGAVLGAATIVRLLASPLAGRRPPRALAVPNGVPAFGK